jgi:hypothetical protein
MNISFQILLNSLSISHLTNTIQPQPPMLQNYTTKIKMPKYVYVKIVMGKG